MIAFRSSILLLLLACVTITTTTQAATTTTPSLRGLQQEVPVAVLLPAEGNKAGPCVHLFNWQDCSRYPTNECFWDAADGRCESRYDGGENAGGGHCGNIRDYWACTGDPRCFWDSADNRCERR